MPCPDPEETKKNAEQDETLKAACVTEAAAAAQEPLKVRVRVKVRVRAPEGRSCTRAR